MWTKPFSFWSNWNSPNPPVWEANDDLLTSVAAPGVCVMIAASIYTQQKDSFHVASLREGSYGASYILAWVSFPMTLTSGVLYLVLRKRK